MKKLLFTSILVLLVLIFTACFATPEHEQQKGKALLTPQLFLSAQY